MNSESESSRKEDKKAEAAELKPTAFHEAGHAVMAVLLGRTVEKLTISPAEFQGGRRLGMCKMQKGRAKPSKDELEDEVLILLAGMVAESHLTGRYCEQGAGSDFRMVERLLANRAKNEKHFERLMKRALDKTEHILSDDAATLAIKLIANDVLQRETISGRAVRHFVQQAEQQCK
jgi:ATP-dependent Zn protease